MRNFKETQSSRRVFKDFEKENIKNESNLTSYVRTYGKKAGALLTVMALFTTAVSCYNDLK